MSLKTKSDKNLCFLIFMFRSVVVLCSSKVKITEVLFLAYFSVSCLWSFCKLCFMSAVYSVLVTFWLKYYIFVDTLRLAGSVVVLVIFPGIDWLRFTHFSMFCFVFCSFAGRVKDLSTKFLLWDLTIYNCDCFMNLWQFDNGLMWFRLQF